MTSGATDSRSGVRLCRNSKAASQAAAPADNKAQERFGNAKSISSAQVSAATVTAFAARCSRLSGQCTFLRIKTDAS